MFHFFSVLSWEHGEMKKTVRALLLMCVFACLFAVSAQAKDYSANGSFYWVEKEGTFYAYDAETNALITDQKVGRYFAQSDGSRLINGFARGVYYNGKGKAKPKFKGGWIKVGGSTYYFKKQKKLTGYRKIGGKRYYFSPMGQRLTGIYFAKGHYRYFKSNGVMVTKKGWKKISGKRYYLKKSGYIEEGFFKVGKKKYYQTVIDGLYTGMKEIDGIKYYFDSNGVYDEKMTAKIRSGSTGGLGDPSDILFFTKFESGNAGYAQVGGDSGHACGKYQFDYRYSLVPFLNYCYDANPTFFEGFKPFIGISKGSSSLVNNRKLYTAWTNCYNEDPAYFSSMQDNYAIEAYYKPAENYLSARGIHLNLRTYVVRGAVFSYAIQEGSTVAAQGVIAAGLKDSTSEYDFLTKLYDYRWKDPRGWGRLSKFMYRYTNEKNLALSYLKKAQPGTF